MPQRLQHAQLVPGQLHVHVELHVCEGLAREVLERLFQAQRRAFVQILVVVGDEQAAAAVGVLAQHVQLDHVHAVA